MIKYIDAEKLKILISRQEKMAKSLNDNLCASYMEIAKQIVDDTPTADVEEVRHGKWIFNTGYHYGEAPYFCSLCTEGESENGYDNYCPHCGARMDGEEK